MCVALLCFALLCSNSKRLQLPNRKLKPRGTRRAKRKGDFFATVAHSCLWGNCSQNALCCEQSAELERNVSYLRDVSAPKAHFWQLLFWRKLHHSCLFSPNGACLCLFGAVSLAFRTTSTKFRLNFCSFWLPFCFLGPLSTRLSSTRRHKHTCAAQNCFISRATCNNLAQRSPVEAHFCCIFALFLPYFRPKNQNQHEPAGPKLRRSNVGLSVCVRTQSVERAHNSLWSCK